MPATHFDCPNCGATLGVAVALGNEMPAEGDQVREYDFTLDGNRYQLRSDEVAAAVDLVSRPVRDVYVTVSDATGSARQVAVRDLLNQSLRLKYGSAYPTNSYFTTQTAERVLRNLGFEVKRRR